MKLSDLKIMVEQDMVIDQSDLSTASLRTPQLHSKYLNHYTDAKLLCKKLDIDYKSLYQKKWEYYSGKMDQDTLDALGWKPFQLKILRQDLSVYLDADTDLALLKSKIDLQKEKASFLESTIKNINNRIWAIKNSIDFKKFINGV